MKEDVKVKEEILDKREERVEKREENMHIILKKREQKQGKYKKRGIREEE